METIAEMQVLLGEARAELEISRREATDLKEALALEKQRADAALKSLNDHLEELRKAGLAAQKLLGSLETQLKSSDALRTRLVKATRLAELVTPYLQALEARPTCCAECPTRCDTPAPESEELKESRKAFMQALLEYNTPDG